MSKLFSGKNKNNKMIVLKELNPAILFQTMLFIINDIKLTFQTIVDVSIALFIAGQFRVLLSYWKTFYILLWINSHTVSTMLFSEIADSAAYIIFYKALQKANGNN